MTVRPLAGPVVSRSTTQRSAMILIAALLMVSTIGRCQENESADVGSVLATIGGRSISVAAFEAEMERRSGGDPARFDSLEERQALLSELVRRELLISKALEAGYDRDPAYVAATERILISRFTEDRLNQSMAGISVTDAEVRQRFEEDRSTYSRPARIQGAMIFLEVKPGYDRARVAEISKRAKELRVLATEYDEATHLGRLALDNSDDRSTRYTGGVLPWMIRSRDYKWGRDVVDALFAIDRVGGVAPVVRTDEGFYVLRLAAREDRQDLPFEMYADGIRRRLLREKQDRARDGFYERLARGTEIAVDPDQLENIPGMRTGPGPEEPPRPPALPGGNAAGDHESDQMEQR